MRLSFYSNAPWTPTGYGTQTAQVIRRMRDDGHDVAVLANHGIVGQTIAWEGIPVYPGGAQQYSLDVAPDQHRAHLAGKPGWVIALYDVWVLKHYFDGENIAGWAMVDSYPVPPEVVAWCRRNRTIACSKFGQQALDDVGIRAAYIPLALDLNEWRPRLSDVRRELNVPDDAFLVTVNAANYPNPQPRKGWWEMFVAFAKFAKDHDDAYLYLHTDLQRPGSTDLIYWMKLAGVPDGRVRAASVTAYRSGNYSTEDLARLYTASDVLLATSLGEGFGLPVIEAQACGTPVIVNDFTAQPELVGAGWKTKNQPTPYLAMGSLLATPSIASVRDALEQAYAARGSEELRQAALLKAAEYDADKVYAERWKPYLAELEAEITPRERKAMSKGAKRRARR